MPDIRLKYVVSDKDRHGNQRWYFRGPDRRKHRLPDPSDHIAFTAAYRRLMVEGHLLPRPKALASQGTFLSLTEAYFASGEFRTKAQATQDQQRRVLTAMMLEPVSRTNPMTIGEVPLDKLSEQALVTLRDRKADKVEAANHRVKVLRALMRFAKKAKLIETDLARDLEQLQSHSDGHHTWTVEEIRQYLAHHESGTTARLALLLLLATGLRISDIWQLGPQMRTGLEFRAPQQKKWGRETIIVMPAAMAAILDAEPPVNRMRYMVTESGNPFASVKSLGNRFKKWCVQAGLPHCTAHGMRKARATLIAESGASSHELKAAFDWRRLSTAEIYTRKAEGRKLSQAAVSRVDWGGG